MAYYLEEEQRCVDQMNAKIGEYFDFLGVSEDKKREFLRKANGMKRSGAFTSEWFHNMTSRLYHLLGQNEPPVVIDDAVEDEGGSSSSSSNVHHFYDHHHLW